MFSADDQRPGRGDEATGGALCDQAAHRLHHGLHSIYHPGEGVGCHAAATTSIANHTFVVSGAASATADPVDPLLVCFGFLLSLEVDDGEQALALGHRAVDGVDVVEFGDGHQPDPTAWR